MHANCQNIFKHKQKQFTAITLKTAMASSSSAKYQCVFMDQRSLSFRNFFWKMKLFLKMMSSWRYEPTRIYYDIIFQKKIKMKKHNRYERSSTWTKFGKKTSCTTFVLQKTEKIICIRIADVSSTRPNCNISWNSQGINFQFSGNLKN